VQVADDGVFLDAARVRHPASIRGFGLKMGTTQPLSSRCPEASAGTGERSTSHSASGNPVRMSAPSGERSLSPVLLALTAVTGFVDAVSYLALGHVFTANMTGNVVFLGFAVAGAPGLSMARSGIALAAFIAGALAGGRLVARPGDDSRPHWPSNGFAIEAALLLVTSALAFGAGHDLLEQPRRLYGLIVLTGLAMGIRNAIVRRLAERDLTTTVLTLTITGIAADSSLAGGTNPGWTRRAAAVALMFAGAAAGAWLLRYSAALALLSGALISALCALGARASGR
jgi:uncharacterized membrane protein YoaK (UPF0700 family)